MISKAKTKPKLHISKGYRYNIKARLADLSYHEKNLVMNYVRKKACTTKNITHGQQLLYRYINEPYGSRKHSKVEILQAFATKFNCTIDELINK